MSQATPTQELAARDLHGFEWRFKHIFRGKCSISILLFAVLMFSDLLNGEKLKKLEFRLFDK